MQKLMRGDQILDADALSALDQVRWDDLRVFLVAGETRSFRAAAKRLGCSLNTIRDRVDNLERTIGAALMTRSVDGVALTLEGAELLEHARRMREIASVAGHVMRVRRQGLSGRVRIAVTEGLGTFWLVPRMVDFHQRHPAVTLDLHCDMRRVDVLRFETDLAVQLDRPEQSDLIAVKLGTLHLMPFASDDYIRLRGSPRDVDELMRHNIVEQRAEQVESFVLDQLLENRRPPDGFVSIRTNTSSAHYWAVAKGAGIGVLPTYVRALSRKVRPIDFELKLRREIWLAYHPDVKRSKAISAAIQWLRKSFDAREFPWFSDDFMHPYELEKHVGRNTAVNLFEGFIDRETVQAGIGA